MAIDVVVLAGGKNSPEMAAATGAENRALIPLGTRTMLEYVVAALRETPALGRIFVVGDVPPSGDYTVVPGRETLLENLMAGLDAAMPNGANSAARVLLCTSDIPFITPNALADFAARAAAAGADLCCSYVPLAACTAKYPDLKRTAIKTAEGRFTFGNVMLVSPNFLQAKQAQIAAAYAARKSPAQIAALLGWSLLVRLFAAQTVLPSLLTVRRLEQAVGHLLGGRAAGICSSYAEIGTDIDNPADVAVARRLLTGS